MTQYESYRDRQEQFYVAYESQTGNLSHYHNCFELFYVLEGEVEIHINGVPYTLTPGQMSACSSFAIHNCRTVQKGKFLVALIAHKFFREYDNVLNNNTLANPILTDTEDKLLLSTLKIAYQLYNCRDILGGDLSAHPQEQLDAQRQIALFLVNLCICACGLTPRTRTTSLVAEAVHILETEFRTDLHVSDIAKRLLCNQAELSEQFNRIIGLSLVEYLNHVRVTEAKYLLRLYPEMTLEEVMTKAGFGSMRSFLRHFKEACHCTPGTFRKTLI